MEIANLNSTIVIIFLTIIVIILSYLTYRFQKIVAAKQGVFRTPNLIISVYHSELWRPFKKARGSDIPDYFIIAGKLHPRRILSLPLVIRLKNIGDKSCEGIKMLLRYHKRLRGGGLDVMKIEPANNFSKEMYPKLFENSNYQTAMVEIGALTPKQPFNINDYITITEATPTLNGTSSLETAPTLNSWEVNIIDYTVYQDDVEPISGRIKIWVVDTSEIPLEDYLLFYNTGRMVDYGKKVGYGFRHILHFLKLSFAGKQTLKNLQLVLYDESQVKRHQDVDEVPPEALKYYFGLEDITGSIYIDGIND